MKKSISMKESLLLAVIMTLVSTLLVSILGSLFGAELAIKLATTGISLVYMTYLLSRSQCKTGQIAITGIWAALTLMSMIIVDAPLIFIGLQVGSLWLVRSLYYYNSILSALGDLLLISAGFTTAAWAWTMTHSLLMSFWSLFLVQALFVLIPKQFNSQGSTTSSQHHRTRDPFEHAHQVAEAALKQWASKY